MGEVITPEPKAPEVTPPEDVQSIKDELAKAKAELEGLRSKDVTLNQKVKIEQDKKEKEQSDTKSLETALTFTLTSKDFIRNNESVLPKGMSDIFKVADKESFDSPIHKANAVKDGLIHSFFSQQSNLDLLTESQKEDLADFQKLTKNGRESKASEVYKNLFEPALESLKRVKKAEELTKSRQGLNPGSDSEQAYKDKLSKMAEKKFFRGKHA